MPNLQAPPPNGGWVDADGVFTPNGVLKVPDNCDCYLTCEPDMPGIYAQCWCTLCYIPILGIKLGCPWHALCPMFTGPGVPNCFGDNPFTTPTEPKLPGNKPPCSKF